MKIKTLLIFGLVGITLLCSFAFVFYYYNSNIQPNTCYVKDVYFLNIVENSVYQNQIKCSDYPIPRVDFSSIDNLLGLNSKIEVIK